MHLADANFDELAALDLHLHAHARNNGHAHAHLDETIDAFDGRQLDVHAERDVMAREKLNHAIAVRRLHDVRDENFIAEFANRYGAAPGKFVARGHDEREVVTHKREAREGG